ncbi:unnamed protein product [Linum tenue]|uniref:Uncharacterized protein n=1 Tax=Linum tenue TaxID=586396 RepID=A0AAV0KGX0_9ROSI|nr:unnamed protein product [Linum tenue]
MSPFSSAPRPRFYKGAPRPFLAPLLLGALLRLLLGASADALAKAPGRRFYEGAPRPFPAPLLLGASVDVLAKAPLPPSHRRFLSSCDDGVSSIVCFFQKHRSAYSRPDTLFARRFQFQGVRGAYHSTVTGGNGFLPARYRLRRCTRFSSKVDFAAYHSLMASNNSQPSASARGASASKKGKEKASSSKVRKMVDRTVYRRSKWRLAEIASDIEDDQSYTRQEVLTEDDTSSADPDPRPSSSRTVTDSGYTILPWRGMWGGEAPPSSARLLGPDKRPSIQLHRVISYIRGLDFDYSSLAKMTKKNPGASGARAQKAPSIPAERTPRSSGKAFDDVEEAEELGKRHASADSPVVVPKKKNKPSLGSIDEILAPPRSRRAVKPKEPVPISPSAALNAPSAFTSALELKKFLKVPLDEGTSPAGSACQHLFQASQLKTDKITLQGVNSRLEDELASVKRQLSDALAAESVSAREEKEKEIAFQAKRIDTLEKELLAMSAARGHQKEEFKKRLIKEREDAVDAHLSSAEFREWQQNLLLGVKKRAFIGIRKKVRSDNPDMKWDTPEVWQAMDDYFLSLGTDNEPSDSDPYPLDEGDSSADDVEVDVEKVGEEGVGDNVDANAGAGEGGGGVVAVDGQGGASDGGTDGDSSSSDNHSSKSD